MAKGVGLDAGGYEVKVVELEGSFRKPRLAKVSIDRVAPPTEEATEETRARDEAEASLHALKEAHVARDNVCLGFPCREAVLREISVPFTGTDAIRKVIKFEAEGEIHSHSVDDMVVDFWVLGERDKTTQVLVAAVPKRNLGVLLDALASTGIEPERVDLDTMALYRVADWAGCFEAIEAATEESASELPATSTHDLVAGSGRKARLVIDVGARSTRVLAVVDGDLIDMRALRVGVDSIADELVANNGLGLRDGREAVQSVLETGEDYQLEPPPAPAEGDEGANGEAEAVATQLQIVTREQVELARDRFLMRLRRELMRFMTGLARIGSVERIWVTGGGSTLDGLDPLLEDVFGCPTERLEVLDKLSHNLDDDEAAWIGPRVAVAVGLALGMMGGPSGFNFRQEELAYRRRFDRIKFPLAIACMLAVFLPFIYGMRGYKKLENLGRQYGALYRIVEDEGSRRANRTTAEFWGHVGFLLNKNQQGSNWIANEIGRKDFDALVDQVVKKPTFERLQLIQSRLSTYLKTKQADTGVYEDLQLPSGFYVLTRFAAIIDRLESSLQSFLVTELELNIPHKADTRHLSFRVAYRGEGFRERHRLLEDAFRQEFAEPSSPFKEFGRAKGETLFAGSEADDVIGAYYDVKVELKEDYREDPE